MTKIVLYVNAANIHTGGGRWLLTALMEEIASFEEVVVYLDERFPHLTETPKSLQVRKVHCNLLSRVKADIELSSNLNTGDIALYFGNLPPIRKSAGKTAVFIQNRYLVDYVSLSGFSFHAQIRIWLERAWLRLFHRNADLLVVQTASMQAALSQTCGIPRTRILVAPFVGQSTSGKESETPAKVGRKSGKQIDFIYPASGEPHKNHDLLVAAWHLLAAEGIHPRLLLTLGDAHFKSLKDRRTETAEHSNIALVNLGALPREKLMSRLKQVDALIFPSLLESFGLPLIEAYQAGLPIVAGELDYVRDVVMPDEVFNPCSALSIARAVKRFMGLDTGTVPVLKGRQFMAAITKELTR